MTAVGARKGGLRGRGVPILLKDEPHDVVTSRSELSDLFTAKHHGQNRTAAQWRVELSLADEFAVFDAADLLEITDDGGNLYGLVRDSAGICLFLGTADEQVAKFPFARPGERWHGYPAYPLRGPAVKGGVGEVGRPRPVVFARMLAARLISQRERKKLMKSDNI